MPNLQPRFDIAWLRVAGQLNERGFTLVTQKKAFHSCNSRLNRIFVDTCYLQTTPGRVCRFVSIAKKLSPHRAATDVNTINYQIQLFEFVKLNLHLVTDTHESSENHQRRCYILRSKNDLGCLKRIKKPGGHFFTMAERRYYDLKAPFCSLCYFQ